MGQSGGIEIPEDESPPSEEPDAINSSITDQF